MERLGENPRVLKACNACKARKVRCSGNPGPCLSCIKRKEACHFSRLKLPRRQNVDLQLTPLQPQSSTLKTAKQEQGSPPRPQQTTGPPTLGASSILPELYVDRLLAKRRLTPDTDRQFSLVKGNGLFGGNYRLSIFSDSRLQSLSMRLRNNRVDELFQKISIAIDRRVAKPSSVVTTESQPKAYFEDQAVAQGWIRLYFQHAHPPYPFIDRPSFEAAAQNSALLDLLQRDKAWCALYHAVLALGCQYDGGGAFEPGRGQAWQLFRICLALFPDLLGLPTSLTILQAMTAMAIFASGISCLSVEHVVMSEAVRRAQSLATVNLTGAAQQTYHKTFWVLYSLEKVASFCFGRTSSFVDCDISCPIPIVPEAIFGDFDWFLAFAQHARLISRALTSIFSVGIRGSPGSYYLTAIDQLNADLEQWRTSMPLSVRPRETFRAGVLEPMARNLALWTHYLYHSFRLVLARATLHLASSYDGLVSSSQQSESKAAIVDTSRSILELSTFIEVEPYTPIWVIAAVPIVALLVLFDVVIHNPRHVETANNLALLDMAGGHFSRLQYASNGTLPGSLITDFSYIAREYASNFCHLETEITGRDNAEGQKALLPGPAKPLPAHGLPPAQIGISMVAPPAEGDILAAQTHSSNTPSDGAASTHADSLSFPISDPFWDFTRDDEVPAGTDVMDLFNYFIPGIDPVFWPGQGDIGGA